MLSKLKREINNLVKKKRELLRKESNKEIEKDEFVKEFNKTDKEWRSKTKEYIKIKRKLMKQEEEQEEENNDKEKKVVRKKKKQGSGRTPAKRSYTMLIINSLLSGEHKTKEQVANAVDKLKPGRDKDKMLDHVDKIIYLSKSNRTERWEKYNWDEDKFLLTKVKK